MAQVTSYADKTAFVSYDNPSANFNGLTSKDIIYDNSKMLIHFPMPSGYEFYKVVGGDVYVAMAHTDSLSHYYYPTQVYTLAGDFNPSNVTYNSKPNGYDYIAQALCYEGGATYLHYVKANPGSALLSRLARYGVYAGIDYATTTDKNYTTLTVYGYGSQYPPYVIFDLEPAEVNLVNCSPSSGYVPKTEANRFSWGHTQDPDVASTVLQTSATFYWRNGTSGSYSSISCGSNEYCILPANSITSASMQWYVTATYNSGDTKTSSVYTCSTTEVTSTAVALSPKDTTISNGEAVRFTWQHIITTGTQQTGAVLQKSTNGSTWSTLASPVGPNQYTDIPSGTFTAGTWYWRVATKNTDNVLGTYSPSVSFQVIAAPPMPTVTLTGINLSAGSNGTGAAPQICWQGEDQQGYEVKIDDNSLGKAYGAETVKQCPYLLEEGTHVFKVRICNRYGLWSPWGSVSLNVIAGTGAEIPLTVTADGSNATLTWSSSGYNYYCIYRDGIPVGRVEKPDAGDFSGSAIDNTAAPGEHTYFVRGVNFYVDLGIIYTYTDSNEVSATLVCSQTEIALLDEHIEWLKLNLSINQIRENSVNYSRNGVYRHITGTEYPIVELSQYKDESILFDCAFNSRLEAKAFKALIGQVVALRTRDDIYTGALMATSRTENEFYISYSCTLRRMAYNEEVSTV